MFTFFWIHLKDQIQIKNTDINAGNYNIVDSVAGVATLLLVASL